MTDRFPRVVLIVEYDDLLNALTADIMEDAGLAGIDHDDRIMATRVEHHGALRIRACDRSNGLVGGDRDELPVGRPTDL